jgi:hypothetical protein
MKLLLPIVVILTCVCSFNAVACPAVAGIPDVNCDGDARVAVLGDSVVFGVGDTVNGGRGGYVRRIARKFPGVWFDNLGSPGEEARRLITVLEDAFAGTGDADIATALTRADIVILDIGRNDWWNFGPPLATWRNLKRVREVIQTKVAVVTGHYPMVVTAQLMGANRTGQGAWVAELVRIIAANNKSTAPTDLKFNAVGKKFLADRVHPTSLGYEQLTKVLTLYLRVTLPKHVAIFRRDADKDGLYDEYEKEKFGTDPENPDTDGDGIVDGKDERPTKSGSIRGR